MKYFVVGDKIFSDARDAKGYALYKKLHNSMAEGHGIEPEIVEVSSETIENPIDYFDKAKNILIEYDFPDEFQDEFLNDFLDQVEAYGNSVGD